jgi:hypothetical protein
MLPGASSSSSATSGVLNSVVTEKLNGDNFLLWQAHILPDIRGALLYGYLDGTAAEPPKEVTTTGADGKEMTIPNPEYARCIAQDQFVLGYLLRNMSKEILVHMVGHTSVASVWA